MRDTFCGWYFKCQSPEQSLAVIPAFHNGGGSIQLITDKGAWYTDFPSSSLSQKKHLIALDKNCFDTTGFTLQLHTPELSAFGAVHFGDLLPLHYDIMGPFRYVPFMECRHSVLSMLHRVTGELQINGVRYCFNNAQGYIEGDRGHSFPKAYAWTHSFFDGGSLMCSVAEIPMGGLHFTGIIGAIRYRGKEYRLATYLGARAVRLENGKLDIRQGPYLFRARLLEQHAHPLHAPVVGDMSRTIRENVSCRASYHFEKDNETLFSFETDRASFEFEY